MFPLFTKVRECLLHGNGYPASPEGVVGNFHGCPEKSDNGIPLVFVQGPHFVDENIRHCGEVLVDQFHQLIGCQFFGKGGKALNIGEIGGNGPGLSPQGWHGLVFVHFVDDLGSQVA